MLGYCVSSFCAGCSFGSEKQHSWGRISPPLSRSTSKPKPNFEIFCLMLLIQDLSEQHVALLGVTKKRKETFWNPNTFLTDPTLRALSLHEPKFCDISQPLPERIRPDTEAEIGTYFPDTTATQIKPDLFTPCSASHVISWSKRFS